MIEEFISNESQDFIIDSAVNSTVTALNCYSCQGGSELVIVLAVLGVLFFCYAIPAITFQLIGFVFYVLAYLFAFVVFVIEELTGKKGWF